MTNYCSQTSSKNEYGRLYHTSTPKSLEKNGWVAGSLPLQQICTKTKSSWDMISVYEGLDRLASTSPLPRIEFYPLSAPGVTETSKIMGVESI